MIDDVKFLFSFVRDMDKPIRGWCPTSYISGEYEKDLEIYNRVQDIKEKYGIDKNH